MNIDRAWELLAEACKTREQTTALSIIRRENLAQFQQIEVMKYRASCRALKTKNGRMPDEQ